MPIIIIIILDIILDDCENLRPWKADVSEKSCDAFVDNKPLQPQDQQPVPLEKSSKNVAKYFIKTLIKYPNKNIAKLPNIYVSIPEAPEGVAVDVAFSLLWRL